MHEEIYAKMNQPENDADCLWDGYIINYGEILWYCIIWNSKFLYICIVQRYVYIFLKSI